MHVCNPSVDVEVRFGASFGRGEGLPIHMDNVACMSTESKLSDCSYLNTHNLRRCAADHSEDAGVVCHRREQSRWCNNCSNVLLLVMYSICICGLFIQVIIFISSSGRHFHIHEHAN